MKIVSWILISLVSLGAAVALVGIIAYLQLPEVNLINGCLKTEMNQVFLCSKSPEYIKISDVAPVARNAILVSEDITFYGHSGFDFSELQNSLMTNLKRGQYARGASTITQQLARNVFLSSEKSILRKVKEAVLTLRLESILSKDQIFEKYLNVVQFGDKIYGIKNAADFYFQKHPKDLNVFESAFLAFLLPNPEKYSESFKKKTLTKYAQARVMDICRKLINTQKITQEEYAGAVASIDRLPWIEGPPEDEALANMNTPSDDGQTDENTEHLDTMIKSSVESLQEDTPDPE